MTKADIGRASPASAQAYASFISHAHAPAPSRSGGWGDRVIMSASLIGRLGSSAFRLSTSTASTSLTGSGASLRTPRNQGPSIMGFENEAERSIGVGPCRPSAGRSKRTCDLTSSIVPRGTSFHRRVAGTSVFSYRMWCGASLMVPLRPPGSSASSDCHQPRCGA